MPTELPARTRGLQSLKTESSAVPSAVELPLLQYIHAEQAAGLMLLVGAVIAMVWANSPWAEAYETMREFPLHILLSEQSVLEWVNTGLMAFFFLQVGLEIKRELVHGQLSTWREAMLPVAAAAGGMFVPITFYLAFTVGGAYVGGWGVPVATDIAFALGVLSLLGRRVPKELKVFLLAFAAADDVGGVIIIATVYTSSLTWWALGGAVAVVAVIALLRRIRLQHEAVFIVLGIALWMFTSRSGVHATIAGVVFGLLVPVRPRYTPGDFRKHSRKLLKSLREAFELNNHEEAEMLLGRFEDLSAGTERPAERMERLTRPWISYLVLPAFALVNCGIELSWSNFQTASMNSAAQGIVVALLAGKFIGVLGATLIASRFGAALPAYVHWHHMVGVSLMAGIGFTVSLFIANLAFDTAALESAKVAILVASVVAAVAGVLVLLFAKPAGRTDNARIPDG